MHECAYVCGAGREKILEVLTSKKINNFPRFVIKISKDVFIF